MGKRFRHIPVGRATWFLTLATFLVTISGGGLGLNRFPASAATPPGPVTLSVPAGGVGMVSTTWTGSVPLGTNALAIRCVDFTGTPADNLTDTFLLQVSGVSDAFYLTHRVRLIVRITWNAHVDYNVNDPR